MMHLSSAVRWAIAATLTAAASASLAGAAASRDGEEIRLSVLVRSVDGEVLPGAVVFLCEGDGESKEPPQRSDTACRVEVTRPDGRVDFVVEDGPRYSVTAQLEGFADTTVFPLSFGPDAEPSVRGPVAVVLNPVCFDC